MMPWSVLSTGLSSFSNPSSIGALYPGVGIEWLLVIILFVAWVIFHVVQLRQEGRRLREESEHYRKIGLDKALKADIPHDTMQ